LRLSDTIGVLTPEQYAVKIGAIASEVSIDLQCHAHNDFGLAFANTLAGLQAGARYFHVTVHGIGERAGMTDLAAAAVALQTLYNVDLGIDTTKMCELGRLVAVAGRHPSVPWMPITGDNVFAHESGSHVNAMLNDTSTFEPFPPEQVGGERRYVLGKHSGRALVEAVLSENGRFATSEQLAQCLAWVRETAVEGSGEVKPKELVEYFDLA
jgi:homocitrate synthase NifV